MSDAAKILALAAKEVGYHEGKSNGHWNNYQKYSPEVPGLEWSQNQAWCATFVSWLALKAGLENLYPRTASCLTGVQWFKSRGRFSDYPAIGAQVFFGSGGGSHTGIVYKYDETYAYTIEGNTNTSGSAEGDGVYRRSRIRRDSYLYGYGYPEFSEGVITADPSKKGKKGFTYRASANTPELPAKSPSVPNSSTKETSMQPVNVWAYKGKTKLKSDGGGKESEDAYNYLRTIRHELRDFARYGGWDYKGKTNYHGTGPETKDAYAYLRGIDAKLDKLVDLLTQVFEDK
ncbi:CHAP domain-containing protein [Streptomyces ardesiacus]|uniref:CHAP domain-containing protein n=1 Tax=Streptomyces ardesiacus TaxID=285564 RepID=UPI00364D5AC9